MAKSKDKAERIVLTSWPELDGSETYLSYWDSHQKVVDQIVEEFESRQLDEGIVEVIEVVVKRRTLVDSRRITKTRVLK